MCHTKANIVYIVANTLMSIAEFRSVLADKLHWAWQIKKNVAIVSMGEYNRMCVYLLAKER